MASERLPLSPLRGRQSSLCRAPANGEKGFAKELLTNAGGGADGMTVTNRRLQKLFNLYNRRYFGGRLPTYKVRARRLPKGTHGY